MFTRTVNIGGKVKDPVKPSTWVQHTRHLCDAVRTALELEKRPPAECRSDNSDDLPIFQHLVPEQIDAIRLKNIAFARAVIPRLNGLLFEGAFDDWPAVDVEASRASNGQIWQPFNDEFTSAVCAAALWITEVIGPDVLRCWADLNACRNQGSRRKGHKARKDTLAIWEGDTLKTGYTFPYILDVRSHDGVKQTATSVSCWPPPHALNVRDMLVRLQEAHAIIISLGVGPRNGEATDLPRDCLLQLSDGDVLIGHTFKLSEGPAGELRHWPLPKTVVGAILQQQKLAELMDPGGRYLFIKFADRRTIEDGKRGLMLFNAFASRVRLSNGDSLASLCIGSVHSHRFRKTVVRLAALSLVGANQILFDVLGHRDPEMTLNYILSDPNLQDEMRQIAREASVAIAAEALETSEDNGGPAASRVADLASRLIPRSGSGELDINDLNRAAEILSQGGRVMLVRRGVLCTKSFNQAGPCTKRAGNPDIGRCDVGCSHRLELAAAKADHRNAIEQILESMPEEGHFMRSWWQGQLLAHLSPFEDLQNEMLADARVRAALAGAGSAIVDQLIEPCLSG
jgi:hypothetical protein